MGERLSSLARKIFDAACKSDDQKVRVISFGSQAKVQAGDFSVGGEDVAKAVKELEEKRLIQSESRSSAGTITYVAIREKK